MAPQQRPAFLNLRIVLPGVYLTAADEKALIAEGAEIAAKIKKTEAFLLTLFLSLRPLRALP
jgi:hypothetical protein